MNPPRRRFLHVLGAAAAGLVTGCTSAVESSSPSSSSAASGAGGSGGIGAGAGGSGGAGTTTMASSGAGCTLPPGIAVGAPGDFATDGLHKVSGTKVLIGRDAGGLYALSAICTHQSCNLNAKGTIQATGVHCNCHGSSFDDLGNVTQGPATKPLPAYALALGCDGQLYADTLTKVPSSTRLVV
jgi:cytochrome b6-f complex iron-sulfur subunit